MPHQSIAHGQSTRPYRRTGSVLICRYPFRPIASVALDVSVVSRECTVSNSTLGVPNCSFTPTVTRDFRISPADSKALGQWDPKSPLYPLNEGLGAPQEGHSGPGRLAPDAKL